MTKKTRSSDACDKCGEVDRLHRCKTGRWDNSDGDRNILICDECYEVVTGFMAGCEGYCDLHIDHTGECRPS